MIFVCVCACLSAENEHVHLEVEPSPPPFFFCFLHPPPPPPFQKALYRPDKLNLHLHARPCIRAFGALHCFSDMGGKCCCCFSASPRHHVFKCTLCLTCSLSCTAWSASSILSFCVLIFSSLASHSSWRRFLFLSCQDKIKVEYNQDHLQALSLESWTIAYILITLLFIQRLWIFTIRGIWDLFICWGGTHFFPFFPNHESMPKSPPALKISQSRGWGWGGLFIFFAHAPELVYSSIPILG